MLLILFKIKLIASCSSSNLLVWDGIPSAYVKISFVTAATDVVTITHISLHAVIGSFLVSLSLKIQTKCHK